MDCTQTPHYFAIYSRKSRFTGTGESIGNQIEFCRNYIRSHFGEEEAASALVYEDEGYSGKNTERPQFRKMMRDAAAGNIEAVVVYRLDRVSRNIGDFAALIEKLNEKNVAFLSVREQFETASPMGRAMMYIASVFSQLERETIAERIRDNLQELAKTGRWLGGITPLGFCSRKKDVSDKDGKRYRHFYLETVPGEIEIVRQIFQWTIVSKSVLETVDLLRIHHCQTRRGEAFSRLAVRNILSNPVYMKADEEAYRYLIENGCRVSMGKECFDGSHGIMIYNRTEQQKGKTHRIRPMNEWIGAVGEHEGIIFAKEWIEIQRILRQPTAKGQKRERNNGLLAGKVICGCCGASMRVKLRVGSNSERRSYYYLCTAKEKSRGTLCRVANVNGSRLEHLVLSDVLEEYKWGQDAFEILSEDEQRELLQTVIQRVIWDGEHVEVYWSSTEEAGENGCMPETKML